MAAVTLGIGIVIGAGGVGAAAADVDGAAPDVTGACVGAGVVDKTGGAAMEESSLL